MSIPTPTPVPKPWWAWLVEAVVLTAIVVGLGLWMASDPSLDDGVKAIVISNATLILRRLSVLLMAWLGGTST